MVLVLDLATRNEWFELADRESMQYIKHALTEWFQEVPSGLLPSPINFFTVLFFSLDFTFYFTLFYSTLQTKRPSIII